MAEDAETARGSAAPQESDKDPAQEQDADTPQITDDRQEQKKDPSAAGDGAGALAPRTALTDEYEMLRHSADRRMLSDRANAPLPPRSDQAAYSRQTALLEAVAGNLHTPVADRIRLAQTMPFPNVLVKLASDPRADVRAAVAANSNDKKWLVGRLAKDEDQGVRTAAMLNPRTSWKMRLEGAQDPSNSVEALRFLATLGVSSEKDALPVLAAMVRRAVALNPTTPDDLVTALSSDPVPDVAHAAQKRLKDGTTEAVVTPNPVQSVPGHGAIGLRQDIPDDR